MSRLFRLCIAAALCIHGVALAATASHTAQAERFLKVVQADRLTVPIYTQMQQMFAYRFAEAGATEAQTAVLERYQARADAMLDKAVDWAQLGPKLAKLYTDQFTEAELKQLTDFYRSPLGAKVLESMPELGSQSMEIVHQSVMQAVPEINRLADEMVQAVTAKQPKAE